MKALLSTRPGGPQTLIVADVELPRPGPAEIRIRIAACGVSYPDTLMIEDRYQFKPPRPFSPGQEVAGRIDALGDAVLGMTVGDKVFTVLPFGGMAEYAVARADRSVLMPAAMPFEDAAVFMGAYGTAYHALVQRATLQPGERLLVIGAAGGVGLGAVQLGLTLGAHVTAAVSSTDRLLLAKEHGAHDGFVYPPGPFDDTSRRHLSEIFKSSGTAFDVVFDAAGGDYTEAALRATRRKGRVLIVGFPAGVARIPMNLPLLKECQIVGVFYGAFSDTEPQRDRQNITELLELYLGGKIRPFVSGTYPLAEAAAALSKLSNRRTTGRLLIELPPLTQLRQSERR
jgi:NADPH:quinone reductase